jgi:lathosterol oxidase
MLDLIFYYAKVYVVLFSLILAFFYAIPTSLFYWFFFIRKSPRIESLRIQRRLPTAKSIRREIKSSVKSMLMFSLFALGMYEAWRLGYTKVYMDPLEYSAGYLVLSFFGLLVFHDTYYYWFHRFMHWRPVYKHMHHLHHLSITPSPFAIYAFQPLEVLVQFGLYPVLLFVVPLHPMVLGVYFFYNILVNTGGHVGHEFLPKWMNHHWFFKWNNTVTHHDLHHTAFHYNYGLYFNVWDRLMGTFKPAPAEEIQQEAS